jgi:hypothetical protein
MTTLKTSELTGAALDWAVAKCEGKIYGIPGTRYEFHPSTHWAHGGPIIERERVNVAVYASLNWMATMNAGKHIECGPTPLIAAMRCYVVNKMGDNINIPKELTQ